MPVGDLYDLQAQFIADLLAQNDAAALRMVKAYSATFEDLRRKWERALNDLVTLEEDATAAQLWLLRFKAERLGILRRQTAGEIERFSRVAGAETIDQQRLAIGVAQEHAAALTAAALANTAPGYGYTFAQLPRGALEDLVGAMTQGSPLRQLFDTMGPQAADSAERVLFRAIATGLNPRVAAGQLRDTLGVPLSRAMVISRTEMLGAYRESNLRSYRNNRDVIEGWRFVAQIGPRTCSACFALHNTVHFLDAFFPKHPACRCSPQPITRSLESLGLPESVTRLAPKPIPTQRPGSVLFGEMSEADQRRVLGPGKLALLKSGRIRLADTVAMRNDPKWGITIREASIPQSLAQHEHAPPEWLRFSLPR